MPCHAISSSRRHLSYIDSVYVNVDIQHPSTPISTIFHREQDSGALLSSRSYSPHFTCKSTRRCLAIAAANHVLTRDCDQNTHITIYLDLGPVSVPSITP